MLTLVYTDYRIIFVHGCVSVFEFFGFLGCQLNFFFLQMLF